MSGPRFNPIDKPLEWTSHAQEKLTVPVINDAAGLKTAVASVAAPVQVLAAGLIAGGKTAILANARHIVITTAGATPSDAPATATIVGTLATVSVTETITLSQIAGSAQTTSRMDTVVSVDYPAADGVGATLAIGFDLSDVFYPPARLAECVGAGAVTFEMPDGNTFSRTMAVGDKVADRAISRITAGPTLVELFR